MQDPGMHAFNFTAKKKVALACNSCTGWVGRAGNLILCSLPTIIPNPHHTNHNNNYCLLSAVASTTSELATGCRQHNIGEVLLPAVTSTTSELATGCRQHNIGACYWLSPAQHRSLLPAVASTTSEFATGCRQHNTGVCYRLSEQYSTQQVQSQTNQRNYKPVAEGQNYKQKQIKKKKNQWDKC